MPRIPSIRNSLATFGTTPNDTIVLLLPKDSAAKLSFMARYSSLLGRRIVVTYRAGDIVLPATGKLAADSGKSVFLEESYQQHGNTKTFRWEIPYPCIMDLSESPEIPRPNAAVPTPRDASVDGAHQPAALEFKKHLA